MATSEPMPPDTRIATIMPDLPPVQQAQRAYSPSGSLQIPNAIATINGMSAKSFMQQLLPYADKTSPMTKASAEESQEAGQQ